MDVIASIKDKMRRVFRLHGAVLTKSLLFRKQKKVLIGDEVSSPRLPPRKETGVPQPPKDTESFLTSLESSGSSVSSLRSSAYSESMLSSDELSMTSSSSNNINSSRMHLSSHQKGSSTKLRTKRKQQQQQQQQPQPKRKSVTVLAQNGELIKIMNGDPEFTPELDTAGQPLRTYSFTTGLLEVNEHLRPTFIATFCVYETLREYNTSVLATLEAEFFTVLCSCLYRPDEKLVTTLGYLKSTGATTGRVKLSDNLDKLNSEFLKKELKELYKALKEINLFSRFTDFYFLKEADPPPPDGTCSGFVFQVTKNKDVLAEGQCVVSEGVKVRLELHIFLDRLNAEMSCDWDKLSGCHVQLDSPCASSENESSISSSVPKVSDKSDKGRDIICSTYGDPMKKVCIIIESNDENYVGLHIASALWEKMFVVVFVFDNVHIDSPLTSDSSLGWSVVVESDGSIKLMKRQMLKSGKIQRLEKDVDRCLDAITRGSIREEPSGVDTAPAETKFDVMYVPKISVKAMKAKNSTKARKPKGSSDSYSDDSFSEDESGLCIGTPASSVFVSYSFMDPQTRAQENEVITQYYKEFLGGLANQFSVVLMVMENIDFTKITVSLYLDPGDSMAYEEYGCLFYHLYKIKRNEKNSLVVIVKHNSRCIGCERYNSSLVLLPEDIARVRKKYKFVPSNTTLPKSISLQQFSSAPPPFPSYSKFSLSSLSASSSSSSSISLDSSGSSLSPTDSSRELNSPQGKPPTKVNPNRGKAGSPKKQQNPAKTSKKAKKTKKQK